MNDPHLLRSQLQALGRRYSAYGIAPEDYVTVGVALLWTLEHGLGDVFNAETKSAWETVYQLLADSAIEGAYVTT